MRKLSLLIGCIVLSFGVSAEVLFTSHCGAQAITVSPEFFESTEEAQEFYAWLDWYLCKDIDEEIETPGEDN